MARAQREQILDESDPLETAASFVLKLDPAPEEGFPDFLHRIVAVNGFRDMNMLNELLGINSKGAWSHFSFTKSRIDSRAFSELTSVSSNRIECLGYRKDSRLVEFFGTPISPCYLSKSRRVSPTFLRERGYQKAIWGLRCFSFDPANMEMLLDRCPGCGESLTYRFTAGPCYCAMCGFDLREAPQKKVTVSDTRPIDFVRYLIDPSRRKDSEWILPEGLRSLSRGEIFAIIVTLGVLLQYERGGGIRDKVCTKGAQFDLAPEILVEASASVLGWSQTFFETAAKIRFTKGHLATQNVHPLVVGIPVNLKPLRLFLTKELSNNVGNWRSQVHSFSDDSVASKVLYQFPKAVEYDAACTGLPRTEILQLYRSGAVACPDNTLRKRLGAMDESLQSVPELLNLMPEGKAGQPLSDIVLSSKPTRHPWAAVFGAIFSGEIRVEKAKDKGFARRFYTADVTKVVGICRSKEPQIDPSTEIGSVDAGFYLSMGYDTIITLKREGLLPDRKLKLSDIWSFQEEFMSTAEIRARLRLAGHSLNNSTLWRCIENMKVDRAAMGALRRTVGESFVSSYLAGTR